MLSFVAPLAFDKDGKALHKGELARLSADGEPEALVEVFNILPNQRVTVIMPDGSMETMNSGFVSKVDRPTEDAPKFDTPSEATLNDISGMQVVRLLTPENEIIHSVADVLIELMKHVQKIVRPIQFKVNKIGHKKVAVDGLVLEGHVDSQIQVQDNYSVRRATIELKSSIVNGKVEPPKSFIHGGREFKFTEAGFREMMNIPRQPYFCKKPTSVQRAMKDTF
jgi:hypothetical protein